MGIVNITPDSFSDGGDFFCQEEALKQALSIASEGADILDIGGESTRPFSDTVSEEEEIRRVIPVIEALASKVSIPISIDTNKSTVAKAAVAAGATVINDISAMRMDPKMAPFVAESGLPIILMHMLGTPKTMQVDPKYKNVVQEIHLYFEKVLKSAESRGISPEKIILDPGIGFGKNLSHNLQLISGLSSFADLGRPILIGTSRKAFIRTLLKDTEGEPLSPKSSKVAAGTQATVAAAALNGAHIVRVHDVAQTRDTLRIIDALKASE
jgi:dihydropteroate synthase